MLAGFAVEKVVKVGKQRGFLPVDAEQVVKADVVAQGDWQEVRRALVAHADEGITVGEVLQQAGGDGGVWRHVRGWCSG